MWPDPGEALSRIISAEAAIADLYREALRRWLPAARAAVGLTAAAAPPPDPNAVGETQAQWEEHAEQVVLAGLLALWAAAFVEASDSLGAEINIPDLPGSDREPPDAPPSRIDAAVLDIVARHADMTPDQVANSVARVQAAPGVGEHATDFVAARRPAAYTIPGRVSEKLAAELADTPQPDITDAPRGAEPPPLSPPEIAAEVLDVDSPAVRAVTDAEKYQAAGVLNHAVLIAAQQSEDAPELEKVWIATIDGKTRPSHWAGDGQRAPLNGHFTIGAEQLAYPGDPTASPAERFNCRCRLGILAHDEPLPDEVDRHTERLDGRDSVAINRDGRTQQEEIERRKRVGNVRARDDDDGIGRVASATPEEHTMAEQDTYRTFTDVLFAVVGTPTSDGRVLSADTEMRFRSTPMPLRWCEKSKGGHDDAVVVGVIEQIGVNEVGEVRGSGYVLNSTNAAEAIDLVEHGVVKPSIDYMSEDVLAYEDGTRVTEQNFDPERRKLVTSRNVEVLAATLVSIPAFGQTTFALDDSRKTLDRALVAAAAATFAPPVYDPQLFADPGLAGPTRITITEDGHVFGHLACWKDRHRSVGLGHMKPPRSRAGYAHFHSSPPVQLSDGGSVPVGRLTVGIGHAPTTGISNAAAMAHYDNAAHCWALVRAGEDRHGIWVSGVVAPWASPEQVQMAMAAPLSGDWRPYGGQYELVAVLSVNTPGFLCAGDTRGEYGLVASLGPSPFTTAGGIDHLSLDDIKTAMVEALNEHHQRAELSQQRAAAVGRAREVAADSLAARRGAVLERARATVEDTSGQIAFHEFAATRLPPQLLAYWTTGAGGRSKIKWGTPNDFYRCRRAIQKAVVKDGDAPLPPNQIDGLCATLHRIATGKHPGKH
ncbi:Uncharacterised protein [Mycolicibacterium vanbaalenii]|uniref:Capsid maturation protease and MuF-like fusion protein n=1 Tax=Mycolicibacterium vanbaalenii TaxID=110539 RepID=A0A5S9R7F5_MYCVN|nr:hypothetical protein [Mycolicibacterium vanbaalenii]CAA0134565.1 Uncharacterised protein [Mycolicibacterium vanbaalenii]